MDEWFDTCGVRLQYFCPHHGNRFRTKPEHLKTKKALLC